MRVVIAGGTGFVGSALTQELLHKGHVVFILTRKKKKSTIPNLFYVQWLSEDAQPNSQLENIDVVINLAGESINSGRWTKERKNKILQSRLDSTTSILKLMSTFTTKPSVFINASAVGYYGTSFTSTFTETSTKHGNDFLATTVRSWEEEASAAEALGIRTVLCRFGIILAQNEGALPKIALPYKLFIGGKLGSGEQWMSWIHLDDVVGGILHCIQNEQLEGPVNFSSPHPVRMKNLGKQLSSVLRRPHWFSTPALLLKIVLGEMSILVLEGQLVLPDKLVKSGYSFHHSHIHSALREIYKS